MDFFFLMDVFARKLVESHEKPRVPAGKILSFIEVSSSLVYMIFNRGIILNMADFQFETDYLCPDESSTETQDLYITHTHIYIYICNIYIFIRNGYIYIIYILYRLDMKI